MSLPMLKSAAALALAAGSLGLAAPVAAAPTTLSAAPVAAPAIVTTLGLESAEHRRSYRHNHGRYGRDRYDDRYDARYDRDDRYDDRYDRRYRQARYDEPVRRDTRVWRGRDGQYYCRKQDGTTGLLIGAGVGALIGNELAGRGDRTLGAILGAGAGALLGRAIDRSNARCR